MSTPNFYKRHASKYFVVKAPEDQGLVDMMIEDYQYQLKSLSYTAPMEREYTNDRDYGGIVIATKEKTKCYEDDLEVVVQIKAVVRCGYYIDGNLDYEIEYLVDGREESLDDFIYAFEGVFSLRKAERYAEYAQRWAEEQWGDLAAELEEFYEEVSTPYVKTAQFSNGEALYQKNDFHQNP